MKTRCIGVSSSNYKQIDCSYVSTKWTMICHNNQSTVVLPDMAPHCIDLWRLVFNLGSYSYLYDNSFSPHLKYKVRNDK